MGWHSKNISTYKLHKDAPIWIANVSSKHCIHSPSSYDKSIAMHVSLMILYIILFVVCRSSKGCNPTITVNGNCK
jgi:hypothetical protein